MVRKMSDCDKCQMTGREAWAAFVLLLFGPVAAVMYLFFGFGYTVFYFLEKHARPLSILWKYTYAPAFAILNFLFNISIGSIMWLERPKFLQFTMRLKDQKEKGNRVARFLCECLNYFDPKHC